MARTSRWRITSKYQTTRQWISSEFLTLYCTIPQAMRIRDAAVIRGYTLPPAWPHRGRVINHKFVPRPHSGVPPNKKHVGKEGEGLRLRSAPLRTARGHAACLKPWHICIPLGVDLRHSCAPQARSKRLFSLSRSSQIALDNGHSLYGLHSFLHTLSRDIWIRQGYAI